MITRHACSKRCEGFLDKNFIARIKMKEKKRERNMPPIKLHKRGIRRGRTHRQLKNRSYRTVSNLRASPLINLTEWSCITQFHLSLFEKMRLPVWFPSFYSLLHFLQSIFRFSTQTNITRDLKLNHLAVNWFGRNIFVAACKIMYF